MTTGFTFTEQPLSSGSHTLQVKDTTNNVLSNAITFNVAATVAGALFVGPTRPYQQIADAFAAAPSGGTVIVDASAAVQTKVATLNKPITIQGAGAYTTVCDGQGGAGSGHTLAGGKGFFLVTSPGVTIQGIGFIRCGGADGVGDAESAIRAEGFGVAGTLSVLYCRFDGCEIANFCALTAFGPSLGQNITYSVQNCEFGRYTSNGNTNTGNTHDCYINSDVVTYTGNVHWGVVSGHNLKSRSRTRTISGNTFAQGQGRWYEAPDGGTGTISGNTFLQLAGAETNALGYADEMANDGAPFPIAVGTDTYTGNTLYIGTAGTNFWAGTGSMAWSNTTQKWVQYPGQGAPSISLVTTAVGTHSAGSISGLTVLSPPGGVTIAPSAVPAIPRAAGIDQTAPNTFAQGGAVWFVGAPTTGTQGTALSGGTMYRADGIATPYAAFVTAASVVLGQPVGSALVGSAVALTQTSNYTADSLPLMTPSASGSLMLATLDGPTGTVMALSPALSVAAAQQGGGGGGTVTPGTPGALPAIQIKAQTAIAVGDPVRVGQVFAYSDVAAGSANKLTVTSSGASAAVQAGGKNAWPDGSLRMASFSFRSPIAIAAGATASFQWGAGTTALTGAGPTSAQLAAMSNITISGTGASSPPALKNVTATTFGGDTYTLNVNAILANSALQWSSSTGWGTNPAQGWEVLDTGPVLTHWRVWSMAKRTSDGAYDRWVKYVAHVTAFANGSGGIAGVEVIADVRQSCTYGPHPAGTLGPTSASSCPCYSGRYTVANGGTTLFSQDNVTTAPGSMAVFADGAAQTFWIAGTRFGTKPSYLPGHDQAYLLHKTRLFPSYDLSLLTAMPTDTVDSPYLCNHRGPLSPGGVRYGYSNGTGDSASDEVIGYLNSSSVHMLFNPFDAKREVRQRGYCLNFFDYYATWEDERTGRLLGRSPTNYPGLIANPSLILRDGDTDGSPAPAFSPTIERVDPLDYQNDYAPLLEASHMPSHWVVPYIRSGHPYFTELGITQTIALLASQLPLRDWPYGPAAAPYVNVLFVPNNQQPRGMGWGIRQLGFTECLLPDTDVCRQLVRDSMDSNSQFCYDLVTTTYMPAVVHALGIVPYWKSASGVWAAFQMAYMGVSTAVQAWRESLSGTRPGFRAYIEACQPALVEYWNQNSGGTSYGADFYECAMTPNGPSYDASGFTDAYQTLAALRAANDAELGFTPPGPATGYQYTHNCFNGNAIPNTAVSVADSPLAGQLSSVAMCVTLGISHASDVWSQMVARMTSSGGNNNGVPTWVYQNGGYSNQWEIALAHAVVPLTG